MYSIYVMELCTKDGVHFGSMQAGLNAWAEKEMNKVGVTRL
jgi:hypothetical protein